MIFVDTSAVLALASHRDLRHDEARRSFAEILRTGHRLLTHSYVLGESMALLQRRLGRKTAIAFAAEARAFEIEWVDQSLHDNAVDALRGAHGGVSLVDQVSFLVMRRRGVDSAFAYDRDFETAGFRLYRT